MLSDDTPAALPDRTVSVRDVFGIDLDLKVPAYAEPEEHVPDLDPDYIFDRETTLAILAGFARNRRVMVTGYHGTGKSTHIEQVAARLNWPCIRINLDSHVSRIDLVGKDAIVLKDGKQVTAFQDGILPWALQNNVALVFDDYPTAQELFLQSSRPVAALEMRRDLLQWEQALKLAKTLAPEQVPYLSREFAQQLEFKGEHEQALAMYLKGLQEGAQQQSGEAQAQQQAHLCRVGIARMTLRQGDVGRGVQLALDTGEAQCCRDCAAICDGFSSIRSCSCWQSCA